MKKKNIFVFILILFLFVFVIAQNISADTMEVFYAANFTAYPSPSNISSSGDWISQIAGGPNNPINVLYGVYEIHAEANTNITGGAGQTIPEEFINISGINGSWATFGYANIDSLSSNISYNPYKNQLSNFSYYQSLALNTTTNSQGPVIFLDSVFNILRYIGLTRSFDSSGNLISISLGGSQTQLTSPLEIIRFQAM